MFSLNWNKNKKCGISPTLKLGKVKHRVLDILGSFFPIGNFGNCNDFHNFQHFAFDEIPEVACVLTRIELLLELGLGNSLCVLERNAHQHRCWNRGFSVVLLHIAELDKLSASGRLITDELDIASEVKCGVNREETAAPFVSADRGKFLCWQDTLAFFKIVHICIKLAYLLCLNCIRKIKLSEESLYYLRTSRICSLDIPVALRMAWTCSFFWRREVRSWVSLAISSSISSSVQFSGRTNWFIGLDCLKSSFAGLVLFFSQRTGFFVSSLCKSIART